jgi:hypothetical protein
LIAIALDGDVEVYKENKKIYYKFWFVGIFPSSKMQVSLRLLHVDFFIFDLD